MLTKKIEQGIYVKFHARVAQTERFFLQCTGGAENFLVQQKEENLIFGW